MKKTMNTLVNTGKVVLLGLCVATLIFVVNFAMDMAGVIDLEKNIHNMEFNTRCQITQLRNDINEKNENIHKKHELKKEYKEKVKELKEEYGM